MLLMIVMGVLSITLLDRVPIDKDRAITSNRISLLKKLVMQDLDAFDIKIQIAEIVKAEAIELKLAITGEDPEAARNYLRLKHGTRTSLSSINEQDIVNRAKADSPGSIGFGLFFDIGLDDRNALYPLFRMREQLINGEKLPAKLLSKLFGFCDGFSYPVVITSIEENGKIFVELESRVADEFKAWLNDGLDRITCFGETKDSIERGLIKAGVKHDHFMIQESGFLECIISCDKKTEGAGIVGLIGPRFPHVKMAVFNAAEINKLRKNK